MNVMNAALGGMLAAQGSLERTAQRIAGASAKSSAEPADTVDLTTEMVALLAARNDFKANAQVFHTGDQMQKKLLEILA